MQLLHTNIKSQLCVEPVSTGLKVHFTFHQITQRPGVLLVKELHLKPERGMGLYVDSESFSSFSSLGFPSQLTLIEIFQTDTGGRRGRGGAAMMCKMVRENCLYYSNARSCHTINKKEKEPSSLSVFTLAKWSCSSPSIHGLTADSVTKHVCTSTGQPTG